MWQGEIRSGKVRSAFHARISVFLVRGRRRTCAREILTGSHLSLFFVLEYTRMPILRLARVKSPYYYLGELSTALRA